MISRNSVTKKLKLEYLTREEQEEVAKLFADKLVFQGNTGLCKSCGQYTQYFIRDTKAKYKWLVYDGVNHFKDMHPTEFDIVTFQWMQEVQINHNQLWNILNLVL